MSLPAEIRDRLSVAFGPVGGVQGIGGGCIGSALRVELGGRPYFLKYLRLSPESFFAVEAAGLEALRQASTPLRIPAVAGFHDAREGWSWILLEWLESGAETDDGQRRLGGGLAALHRATADHWGWNRDGFIGRLPQSNTPASDWAAFWTSRRLQPQLDALPDTVAVGSAAEWERLFNAMTRLLGPAEEDGPSLLHGDLWIGNVMFGPAGPALVDPACYFGHREVDLAMADLFGGFGRDFFTGYEATWPLLPGYDVRRRVYQLYYLLVHVNLFGSSYAPRTMATLHSVLAEI